MKVFLIFLIVCFGLTTRTNADELDLPSVIILGEVEPLPGHKIETTIDKKYLKVDSNLNFNYERKSELPERSYVVVDTLSDKAGIIMLEYYSRDEISAQAVYFSRYPLLNFSGTVAHKAPKDKWDSSRAKFKWFNQNRNLRLDFAVNYLEYNYLGGTGDEGSTELMSPGMSIIYYLEKPVFAGLNKGEISVSHVNTKQTGLGEKKEIDFSLLLDFKPDYTAFEFNLYSAYLRNAPVIDYRFIHPDVPYLQKAGLSLVADKYHIYPSLFFFTRYELLRGLGLTAKNIPRTKALSRKEMLSENSYQHINLKQRNTKIPLNLSVIIDSGYGIPLGLGYNFSWSKDFMFYNNSEPNDLFYQDFDSVTQHSFFAVLRWNYNKVTLKNKLIKNLVSLSKNDFDYLPYEPGITNETLLEVDFSGWSISSSLNYLGQRKDLWKNELPDVVLLDVFLRRCFNQRFIFSLGAKNMLDEKYVRFSQEPAVEYRLPTEGLNLTIGLGYYW